MSEEKIAEASLEDTKKKSFLGIFVKYKKVFQVIVSLVIVFLLFLLIYSPLKKYYYSIRDRYVIPEPEWEEYDEESTEDGFVLLKLTKMIEDSGVSSSTFFSNRTSVNGGDSEREECVGTQYKCGDGEWTDFEGDYLALSNNCIVKVKPQTYCNAILPGGTLITGINYKKQTGSVRNIFSDGSMMFQVNIHEKDITVIQNVTYQESALWSEVASGKKYYVKVGDQVIRSTGTRFATIARNSTNTITTVVTKGSVKVNSNTGSTAVSVGKYLTGSSFNTSQCPLTLKACGSNCIPNNGVCCDEATSSYCLSPLSCTSNETGKCSSSILWGNSSNYCCSNSDLADDFSMFHRGSYDCKEGYKFCGMSCIPEDETCCYPTDDNCPTEDTEAVKTDIEEGTSFPRAYTMNIYTTILSNPTFKSYVLDDNFPFDEEFLKTTLEYVTSKFKDRFLKDYADSNDEDEKQRYCETFTSNCNSISSNSQSDTTPTSGSSDIACSDIIKEIHSCLPAGVTGMGCKSGTRQCIGIFADGGYGDGCIPERCVK